MRNGASVAAILPVLNEEASIARVLAEIPDWVDDVVVVDNGSSDRSAEVARSAGARVLREPRRGYGHACMTGIASLSRPDVVVFLDGDYSDHPQEMDRVVDPILDGQAQMVIGSRVLGDCQPGALTPQARFGNWLTCTLVRAIWGQRYTDLGPFRAISLPALESLGMADPNYAWTIEMQIKAVQRGLRIVEVPVSYRRRIGESKVSGTWRGVVLAGSKILAYVAWMALAERR
jgi:glycosyltransferase involved in cell wall biosynthesis